ncbi:hypothetical protein IAU60_003280 [Kwoniella sp. DSM 27419]
MSEIAITSTPSTALVPRGRHWTPSPDHTSDSGSDDQDTPVKPGSASNSSLERMLALAPAPTPPWHERSSSDTQTGAQSVSADTADQYRAIVVRHFANSWNRDPGSKSPALTRTHSALDHEPRPGVGRTMRSGRQKARENTRKSCGTTCRACRSTLAQGSSPRFPSTSSGSLFTFAQESDFESMIEKLKQAGPVSEVNTKTFSPDGPMTVTTEVRGHTPDGELATISYTSTTAIPGPAV